MKGCAAARNGGKQTTQTVERRQLRHISQPPQKSAFPHLLLHSYKNSTSKSDERRIFADINTVIFHDFQYSLACLNHLTHILILEVDMIKRLKKMLNRNQQPAPVAVVPADPVVPAAPANQVVIVAPVLQQRGELYFTDVNHGMVRSIGFQAYNINFDELEQARGNRSNKC